MYILHKIVMQLLCPFLYYYDLSMALKNIIAYLNKGEKLNGDNYNIGILKFNMFWKSKRFSRPLMLK